jgi:hypothetical protein
MSHSETAANLETFVTLSLHFRSTRCSLWLDVDDCLDGEVRVVAPLAPSTCLSSGMGSNV